MPTATWAPPRFSIETKRANLPAVLDLLRQIVREPSLPAEELGRAASGNRLANLDEQLTDPQSLALVRHAATINPYPKDDVRYIPTPQEEIEEVSEPEDRPISRSSIGDYLGSQAGELSMVGDFDPDEIRSAAGEDVWPLGTAKQPYERIQKVVFDKVPRAAGNRSSRPTRPTPSILPANRLP